MNFGAALKKARNQAGWSQDKLAEAVGVVRQTVYEWERGDKVPQLERLPGIAKALGISTPQLIELAECGLEQPAPVPKVAADSILPERTKNVIDRVRSDLKVSQAKLLALLKYLELIPYDEQVERQRVASELEQHFAEEMEILDRLSYELLGRPLEQLPIDVKASLRASGVIGPREYQPPARPATAEKRFTGGTHEAKQAAHSTQKPQRKRKEPGGGKKPEQ